MKTPSSLVALALLASSVAFATSARATNDYPTAARVLYVQDCIAQHPGHSNYEMVSKCSCALDAMAETTRYDDFVTMSTIVNARTIGGERGGVLRENETLDAPAKRFKELQAQAAKGCFLGP